MPDTRRPRLERDVEILRYVKSLRLPSDTPHILRIAFATMKMLMLNGESDMIRLKAADMVLRYVKRITPKRVQVDELRALAERIAAMEKAGEALPDGLRKAS